MLDSHPRSRIDSDFQLEVFDVSEVIKRRDRFARDAMKVALEFHLQNNKENRFKPEKISQMAYQLADAMEKQRFKVAKDRFSGATQFSLLEHSTDHSIVKMGCSEFEFSVMSQGKIRWSALAYCGNSLEKLNECCNEKRMVDFYGNNYLSSPCFIDSIEENEEDSSKARITFSIDKENFPYLVHF